MKQEDSLKKRYLFKLLTNLIGIPISIVTFSLVPRSLGPIAYGNFSFLTDFFARIAGFLDNGTSIAFYTKLSQRQHEKGLVVFYWRFVVLIFALLIGFVFVVSSSSFYEKVWPEQNIKFIWLAFLYSSLLWTSEHIMRIIDAYGFTKGGETVRMISKFIGLILIVSLFFFDLLNLTNYFLHHFFLLFCLIAGWWYILRKNNRQLFPSIRLLNSEIRKYISEFYKYSAPLIGYSVFSVGIAILDRWLLQKFSGSVQQGYFGLAFQIGAFCFLFAQAMTQIITREFSVAFSKNDIQEMGRLFKKYVPMLYSVVSYFSLFLAFQSQKVSSIIGGTEFQSASFAVFIMVLYPIHQTYGQLTGSIFYAAGRTKQYRNIGIIVAILSVPISIVLLAPSEYLGLDLGALGLAVKMTGIQFFSVNILLWYNCRFLKLTFRSFFLAQITSLLIIGTLAYFSMTIVDKLVSNEFYALLISGMIYTCEVVVTILIYPKLFSFERSEVKHHIDLIKEKIQQFVTN